ncbi:MAG: thymidine phosphorylase, partial [Aurantibacter sp.]
EMAEVCPVAHGMEMAEDLLSQGVAFEKFSAICQAQGGMKEVPVAPYQHQVLAHRSGKIISVDNRKLAKLAKLAGAPYDLAAGLYLYGATGEYIEMGQPLYCIHSESKGELKYALRYVESEDAIFTIT